jgi:ketosteroid isomerase-like protein
VKARQELLDTDHAFARLAAEKGVANAFYEYAADDATVLPAGELPIKGRDAIKVAMSTSNGTLIWQPSDSQVSGSTDFGYTWGPYFFVPPGGTRPPTPTGHYVTVWRKQSDGAWKFVLEMGNPAPPSRAPQP